MKKFFLIASLMVAVVLAACGKKGEAAAPTAAPEASTPAVVAPVAPAASDVAAAPAVPAASDAAAALAASNTVASAPVAKQ